MDIEQNPKHAARATKMDRQVQPEKKAYTHDTISLKQANREGVCVKESKAIIGECQGWGFTLCMPTRRKPCQWL